MRSSAVSRHTPPHPRLTHTINKQTKHQPVQVMIVVTAIVRSCNKGSLPFLYMHARSMRYHLICMQAIPTGAFVSCVLYHTQRPMILHSVPSKRRCRNPFLKSSISSTSFAASLVSTSGRSFPTHTLSSIRMPMPRKCSGHRSSLSTYTPGSTVMHCPAINRPVREKPGASCTANPT